METSVPEGDIPQWALFTFETSVDITGVSASLEVSGITIGYVDGDYAVIGSLSAGSSTFIPFSVMGEAGDYPATLYVWYNINGEDKWIAFEVTIKVLKNYIDIGTNTLNTNDGSASISYSLATEPLSPLQVIKNYF